MDRDLEIERRLTTLETQCQSLPKILEKLEHIEERFTKYDSRWGTLLMVGTALWAVFAAFKDNILGWFKGS